MRQGWAFVLAAYVVGTAAWAADIAVEPDRMLSVDGQRTFVLGLYENPGDDAVLRQAADAGFNLVQSKPETAALDRLQQHGLHAWINTGASIDFSEDPAGREASLRKLVEQFAGHPALLAWEVPDEALWNVWYSANLWRRRDEPKQQNEKIAALTDAALAETLRAQRREADALFVRGDYAGSERLADDIWRKLGQEPPQPNLNISNAPERAAKMAAGMQAGYDLLKQIDPKRPVWMNHAPRNQIGQLATFNRAADVVGCDIYPVPAFRGGHSDLADRSMGSVGAFTDRMQAAAPNKPVWMVLQGFGWADLDETADAQERETMRRPTFEESRFMAYDAVAHGARGILYWGTAYIEKDSQLWQDLLKLAAELNRMQPLLSAPAAPFAVQTSHAETWGSVDRGVLVRPKTVDGRVWLLIINEWYEPLTYTVAGLQSVEGARYADADAGVEATVQGGRITLTVPGYGIQILRPAE